MKENQLSVKLEMVDAVYSLEKVTRVELVTKECREVIGQKQTNVRISIQDNGRTLKIFTEDEN